MNTDTSIENTDNLKSDEDSSEEQRHQDPEEKEEEEEEEEKEHEINSTLTGASKDLISSTSAMNLTPLSGTGTGTGAVVLSSPVQTVSDSAATTTTNNNDDTTIDNSINTAATKPADSLSTPPSRRATVGPGVVGPSEPSSTTHTVSRVTQQ